MGRAISTDEQGRFAIDSLDPGRYDVNATYITFRDTTLQGIQVEPGVTTFIKIVLPRYCVYDSRAESGLCPVCSKKDAVIPIQYGLLIGDETHGLKMDGKQRYALDQGKWYVGGCVISDCDPNWYCRTDSLKF